MIARSKLIVYTTHLVTPAFSATAIAASSAAVSTSGLRGRKEDVRKLNMSRGERTLEKKSTTILQECSAQMPIFKQQQAMGLFISSQS